MSNNNNLRLRYAHQQPHYINNGTIVQPILHEPPIVYGNSTNIQHYYQPHEQQHYIMQHHHYPPPPPQNILYTPSPPQMLGYYSQNNDMMVRSSPSSISSAGGGSPRTPPPSNRNNHKLPQPKHTIPSSSPPTNSIMVTPLSSIPPSTSISNTEERVKETIARANTIPIEFYQAEFHEYSKNSYQNTASKKRKRAVTDDNSSNNFKKFNLSDLNEEEYDDSEERQNSSELRRQVHIQSEQKRRAQIKDGFEVLKSHLPGCANKKMSKAALLTRTVQQLEHMKKMQSELLAEVERLAEENANLKSKLSSTCQQPEQQSVAMILPTRQQQKISINNNKVYTC